MTQDWTTAKRMVGEQGAEWVRDGMILGLGTGSTVYWMIRRLGFLIKEKGMKVRGVPTSRQTERLAQTFDIPLLKPRDVKELDLVFDGADAITSSLDVIKGGGGALLREKIVATAGKKFVILADSSKKTESFTRMPVPVEVVPFGWEWTMRKLEELGCSVSLRKRAD